MSLKMCLGLNISCRDIFLIAQKKSSTITSNIIKSDLLNKGDESLSTNITNLRRHPQTLLLLSVLSPIISGRSLIRFHVSHEVSFSSKLIPAFISKVCGLFASSIQAYLKPESRKNEEKLFLSH